MPQALKTVPFAAQGMRGVRKHRRISIHECAEHIGCSDNSYVRYENGSRRMYFDHAVAISKLLRCTPDDLTIYRHEDQLYERFGAPGPPQQECGSEQLATLASMGYAGHMSAPPPPQDSEASGAFTSAQLAEMDASGVDPESLGE